MIREVALVALAFGTGNIASVLPAHAQNGVLCGFGSIPDRNAGGGAQIGVLDSGPLLAADVDNPGEENASISIRCTIQIGAQGATHAGADAATAASPATPGATILPPTVVSFVWTPGTPLFLCSQAIVNGQVRYWDADNPDNPSDPVGWSLSSTADCT